MNFEFGKPLKLGVIQVENLRLRAYIGFMDWEKQLLQDLVISYSFKYDMGRATLEDDVEYAVNYKVLTKALIELVDQKSFNLLEHLADLIFESISNFDVRIQDIDVKVEKPNALRFCDNVMVKLTSKDRLNLALIGLGSNLDAEENFDKVLKHLRDLGQLYKRSDFIYTKALKFEEQPDFLNGAVLLYTSYSLIELSLALKEIETLMGRVRGENKNAPRNIDLDVLTYNGHIIDPDIREMPFLERFVQQLQPEILL